MIGVSGSEDGLRNIQSNTYTWDSVGNLTSRHNNGAHISLDPNSITQKNRQEGFCYDALNRLIARLPKITARLQDYRGQVLQDYKITRLQDYKITRLQDYKITRLPGSGLEL